jgi:hypothetical protein
LAHGGANREDVRAQHLGGWTKVAGVVAYGLKTPKNTKKIRKKQVKWEGEIRKSAPSSLGDRVFSKVILSSWHKGYILLLHRKPDMP